MLRLVFLAFWTFGVLNDVFVAGLPGSRSTSSSTVVTPFSSYTRASLCLSRAFGPCFVSRLSQLSVQSFPFPVFFIREFRQYPL